MKYFNAGLLATIALSSTAMMLLPAQSASAADRSADIEVKNRTNETITDVVVLHRYSTDKPTRNKVDEIQKRKDANLRSTAKYRTGFGRTGKSWWKLTWKNGDGDSCFTDPNNGQGGEFRGYKRHNLTSKDDDEVVTISIKSNNIVTLYSPSGTSTTRYSCF